MARLFGTGFERNSTDEWTAVSGATILSTSGLDMDGSYCLEMTGASDYISKTLALSQSKIYMACLLRPSSSDFRSIVQFYDSAGTNIAAVARNTSTGLVELYLRYAGSTRLATGSIALSVSTTYLIEIYYKPLNSGGELSVKIDGVLDASYTGDTTYGLENIQTFRFGYSSYAAPYIYIDNVVVDDSGWIGRTYFQALTVSGAGTTTQWDASTGSNYATVDEIPYSDTDYNSTNVSDKIDTFALSNLSGTINSIKAVYLNARAAYEGSPTPTHIQLGVRSGGADYFDTNLSPPSSFGHIGKILETDPATSAAWTESGVNAMEIGYKAVA